MQVRPFHRLALAVAATRWGISSRATADLSRFKAPFESRVMENSRGATYPIHRSDEVKDGLVFSQDIIYVTERIDAFMGIRKKRIELSRSTLMS